MAPRPLRPKDERAPVAAEDKAPEPQGSKRRAVSSACIPCRKRKSKCDGAQPACSTCTAVYRTECVYDADSDHRRKGALKRDLQSLQERNDAFDIIVTSLRDLPETEAISLLHAIRGETNLEALAASLRTNVNLPQNLSYQTLNAEFEQLSPAPSSSRGANVTLSISRENSAEDAQLHSGPATLGDALKFWFSVPHDPEFVQHLLSLYFCWVHPFHQYFSRENFLHDLSRARSENCSSLLLNAILALACEYSDRPSARLIPMSPSTAGDEFFAEARRLLEVGEVTSLMKVQAIAILGMREASHGRDSRGYQFIGAAGRMALELGLHLDAVKDAISAEEHENRKVTLWSIFFLENMLCIFLGRVSQLPRAAIRTQKPIVFDQMADEIWQRYDDGMSVSDQQTGQSPHPTLLLNQMASLAEIGSDVVHDFYAPREHERFTTRKLALAYDRYHEWFRQLPDVCRLEHTSVPHVILLHMLYYACVLHLFRPYIKLDLRGANLYPHDTCTLCANEISRLSNIFRATHGLRRASPPFSSLLLSASTIHLLNLPSEESTAYLSQGLRDLHTIALHHHFAARCIGILYSLAERWGIKLPDGAWADASIWSDEFPDLLSSASWVSYQQAGILQSESGAPESMQQDYGFLPPPLIEQQSVLPTGPSPAIVPDARYSQDAIWTPFLSQAMPASQQSLSSSVSTQPASREGAGTSWTLAERSARSSADPQMRRSSGYNRP